MESKVTIIESEKEELRNERKDLGIRVGQECQADPEPSLHWMITKKKRIFSHFTELLSTYQFEDKTDTHRSHIANWTNRCTHLSTSTPHTFDVRPSCFRQEWQGICSLCLGADCLCAFHNIIPARRKLSATCSTTFTPPARATFP